MTEPPAELGKSRSLYHPEASIRLGEKSRQCNDFMMGAELFHGFCKRNVTDSAGEEIAAGDVARGIATENDGRAERSLEFIANAWIEHGGLLPVRGQRELAVLDGEAVGGLQFAAFVLAGVFGEGCRGRLDGLNFFKRLRRGACRSKSEPLGIPSDVPKSISRPSEAAKWLASRGLKCKP